MKQYESVKKDLLFSKSMFIYYCGYEKCDGGHAFGPAVRTQYLLHFVKSGCGVYTVKNTDYRVKAGELFLIKPGESTYYKADDNDPWEYMWVAFDGFEAFELIKKIGLEDKYVASLPNPEVFGKNISGIISEFENGTSSDYKILGYFYSAMAQLEKATDTHTFEEEYYAKAIDYIQNNYSYPIRISDLARYVGVDRTYLYKIFMNVQNISPKQYLLSVRISAAKNMLVTGRYSVAEIALSCGFSDSAAFCNHFKRITGKTPRQCIRETEGIIQQAFEDSQT